ncbi:MAG: class I SAM-dependent methyltransferase [Rhodobacteraceae bacterium]|nr:class I SAM-dependent methyltransferase [Paracoccaceae bacterium]
MAVYDAKAAEYSQIHHGDATAGRLDGFVATLPPGGAVLDLGCGPGWAAAAMRDAGMAVTAMDASREMAQVARARHGLDVRVASFSELDDVAAFDGVWAHFSLLHAPRDALPAHLAAIHRALRPDGQLYLVMKLGKGEGRDRLGRLYTYVSMDELRALLTGAGFRIEAEEVAPTMGFDGTPDDSGFIRARRD